MGVPMSRLGLYAIYVTCPNHHGVTYHAEVLPDERWGADATHPGLYLPPVLQLADEATCPVCGADVTHMVNAAIQSVDLDAEARADTPELDYLHLTHGDFEY